MYLSVSLTMYSALAFLTNSLNASGVIINDDRKLIGAIIMNDGYRKCYYNERWLSQVLL